MRAALGECGLMTGPDYRGVPVIAVAQGIPGTEWAMVAKVDQEEIDAPIRKETRQLGLVVVLSLVAVSLGAGLMARRQRLQSMRLELAERQRAEAAVRMSEARFRGLFESAHDGLLVLRGRSWRFVSASPASVRMFGASDEEAMLTRTPWELSPERQPDGLASADKAHAMIARAVQDGFCSCEWTHRRANGEEFCADVVLVRMGAGDPVLQATVRDLTERKQSEAAIRERELQLRALGDNLPGGILYQILVTPDGRIRYTYISAGVERILGVNPEQVRADALAFWSMIVETDRERVMAVQATALQQMSTFDCEFRQHTAAGDIRWLRVRAQPRPMADGAALWDGVASDITERKLAEEAERREAAINRAIIGSVPGTFYMLDAVGCSVRWNDYQRDEIVGKPEAEVAGFPAIETIHPDDRALIQERIANVLRDGREEVVEGRVLLRGGPAFRWMLMTGRRMVIDGQPHLVGFGIDLTERRRAELALQQNEQKYRGIFDESVAAIYVLDREKRFLDSNQAGLDLLGYTREELLRLGIPDVDADPVVVLPAHQELRAGGRLVNYEHRLRRKDGKVVIVLNNSRALTDEAGNIVGMQSTLFDITERKHTETSLRQSEQRLHMALDAAHMGGQISAFDICAAHPSPRICRGVHPGRRRFIGVTSPQATVTQPIADVRLPIVGCRGPTPIGCQHLRSPRQIPTAQRNALS
jgi:PAS domain S-box-containing protein